MRAKAIRVIGKVWDKGYLYHYVPIFPSDQWWNLWYIPFLILGWFLASLIPTPAWLTPEIATIIVSIIAMAFFGTSGLLILFFIYGMLTDPVTDGKMFPRKWIRRKREK
jgi:hypothetical protein